MSDASPDDYPPFASPPCPGYLGSLVTNEVDAAPAIACRPVLTIGPVRELRARSSTGLLPLWLSFRLEHLLIGRAIQQYYLSLLVVLHTLRAATRQFA